jgi:hypothetical protein
VIALAREKGFDLSSKGSMPLGFDYGCNKPCKPPKKCWKKCEDHYNNIGTMSVDDPPLQSQLGGWNDIIQAEPDPSAARNDEENPRNTMGLRFGGITQWNMQSVPVTAIPCSDNTELFT